MSSSLTLLRSIFRFVAIRRRTTSSSSLFISFGSLPCSLPELMTMFVPMCPGITRVAFTCGALRRRSVMSDSVRPFTANFAELYAV